ncbi:MAG: alpha/beta fold hydrolase [Elusimicrobia bacterium]|nr:alpha/beta fold hydrolase [Elusimicrobiota bacterium]
MPVVSTAAVVLAAAQAVSFATKDGWTISAQYRPAAAGKATVVLAHGVASAGGEWGRLTESLAAKGIGTVAVDLRGHAGSRQGPPGSGDYTSFDAHAQWPSAAEDLRAAAAWLKKKGAPDSRIAFGGASIGANLASIVAAERTSAPFLLLLSPSENYRGVFLKTRAGLKTLAAASPADSYAYVAVRRLEAEKRATIVYAPGGHGVQMFEDAATYQRIVDWIAAASAPVKK